MGPPRIGLNAEWTERKPGVVIPAYTQYCWGWGQDECYKFEASLVGIYTRFPASLGYITRPYVKK